MTPSVYFRTPDLVPLDALTTLGISVKDSENPIGFFGSGFKYALAWLLRNDHGIEIHRRVAGVPLCPITFSTKPISVRGKSFKLIQIHEEPNPPRQLGFSTDLGPTWQAWQAYRELHSNTLDERGEILTSFTWSRPTETIVCVTGAEFFGAYEKRAQTFLEGTPAWQSDELAVYLQSSSQFFYRGVRALETNRASPLTFNFIRRMPLTEDRTLSDSYYSLTYALTCALANCTDERILSIFCFNEAKSLDDFHWTPTCVREDSALGKFALKHGRNPRLRALAADWVREVRAKQESLAAVLHQMTSAEQSMLARVCDLLEAVDLPIRSYEIEVYATLGKNILGTGSQKIRLSRAAFERGTFDLAITVLEEFIHVSTGAKDHTREFQEVILRKLLQEFCNRTGAAL